MNGQPMGRAELTAEAQTQLIAGSDTTSKYVESSFSAIFFCKGGGGRLPRTPILILSYLFFFFLVRHALSLITSLHILRRRESCMLNWMKRSDRVFVLMRI